MWAKSYVNYIVMSVSQMFGRNALRMSEKWGIFSPFSFIE